MGAGQWNTRSPVFICQLYFVPFLCIVLAKFQMNEWKKFKWTIEQSVDLTTAHIIQWNEIKIKNPTKKKQDHERVKRKWFQKKLEQQGKQR